MRRTAIHAGPFYPRFEPQIRHMIEQWPVQNPAQPPQGRSLGLILPHAGYIYSGQTAAKGLSGCLHETIDTFIILHPSHQANHFDYSISPYSSYESPLGDLLQDTQLASSLTSEGFQSIHSSYHAKEHSAEIQFPLIKYYFPKSQILPIMLGRQHPESSQQLAQILYDTITRSHKRIVVIASTDLSHYHHAITAQKLDTKLQDCILGLDPHTLWQDIMAGTCEACGIGAILCLLYLAKLYSGTKVSILDYTHSGMSSGNNHQVVGYLAARLYI